MRLSILMLGRRETIELPESFEPFERLSFRLNYRLTPHVRSRIPGVEAHEPFLPSSALTLNF